MPNGQEEIGYRWSKRPVVAAGVHTMFNKGITKINPPRKPLYGDFSVRGCLIRVGELPILWGSSRNLVRQSRVAADRTACGRASEEQEVPADPIPCSG
jgi:hypothetical protein